MGWDGGTSKKSTPSRRIVLYAFSRCCWCARPSRHGPRLAGGHGVAATADSLVCTPQPALAMPDGGCLGASWCRGDGGRRGRHEDVFRSCRACASRTWVVRLDRCVDVVVSAHEQDGDVKGHTGRRTASRSCGDTRRTASRSCGDTHFHGRRRRMFPRRQQCVACNDIMCGRGVAAAAEKEARVR